MTISSIRDHALYERKDKAEFALVCHATMSVSKLPVVVLENTPTSEFTVVPATEFNDFFTHKPFRHR